jgi:hypothetical protein
MSPPARGPGRAVRVRDAHRTWLTAHFLVLLAGLAAAALANRFVWPDRLFVHWVALGWGAIFAVHLGIFAKATLATMGGR